MAELGLSSYDAEVLTSDRSLADYFEKAVAAAPAGTAKTVSNLLTTELLGRLNAEGKTATQSPIPAGYVEAAAGLEAAGRQEAASVAYDAAIARWPHAPLAWFGRGNIAYGKGDLAAAADAYRRAIELSPQDPAARNNLGQVLADANCLPEASGQLARAAALADGTALAAAVAATRAKIVSLSPAAACSLPDRTWPD
jgi:tetratricopeptide (TPR) repeat protein